MYIVLGIVSAGVLLSLLVMMDAGTILDEKEEKDPPDAKILLDKSGPYIGVDFAHDTGYTGKGIKIGVIDTGVDFTHPDLDGTNDGDDNTSRNNTTQIYTGYNFVDNTKPPFDYNGHGTQVAGIIGARGSITGIAPNAEILAYKVSGNGESVSSELIIEAIKKAIEDQVDVINISLGVNKTNSRIDKVVNQAVSNGIVVAVAAGNDGPLPNTIGSPGVNPNAITVGATYNNITSSLVATFQINQTQYQVIPMLGTSSIANPIEGKITDGAYGRIRDLEKIDVTGDILLVERGSDIVNETIYFTEKEINAARAGAKAIIVYNNIPGMYLGDVSQSFTIPNYKPTIPIVSMSQENGMKIKNMLKQNNGEKTQITGTLNIFYNPDYVAFFSSRGPVSPFYIKPDIVAPGAFVNSTDIGGIYNFSSGTSFATPHVAGAAALLLEKYPGLGPHKVKAILTSTTSPVTDSYGNDFGLSETGAGRINIQNALNAQFVVEPAFIIAVFSPAEKEQVHNIRLEKIVKENDTQKEKQNNTKMKDATKVQIDLPQTIDVNYTIFENNNTLQIRMVSLDNKTVTKKDDEQGRITIRHHNDNKTEYRIPILIKYTQGTIDVQYNVDKQQLEFNILYPTDWKYAKVSVTNKETGETYTKSLTPKYNSVIKITESAEYWIETSITGYNQTYYGYNTIQIQNMYVNNNNIDIFSQIKIPYQTMYIIISIAGVIALIGVKFRMMNIKESSR